MKNKEIEILSVKPVAKCITYATKISELPIEKTLHKCGPRSSIDNFAFNPINDIVTFEIRFNENICEIEHVEKDTFYNKNSLIKLKKLLNDYLLDKDVLLNNKNEILSCKFNGYYFYLKGNKELIVNTFSKKEYKKIGFDIINILKTHGYIDYVFEIQAHSNFEQIRYKDVFLEQWDKKNKL